MTPDPRHSTPLDGLWPQTADLGGAVRRQVTLSETRYPARADQLNDDPVAWQPEQVRAWSWTVVVVLAHTIIVVLLLLFLALTLRLALR